MSYEGTPDLLRDCPICGSTDKRCRQRDTLILCMGRLDGTKRDIQNGEPGEKTLGSDGQEYTYVGRATGAGEWGEWVVIDETGKEDREQLKNERLAQEGSAPPYDMPASDRHKNYSAILSQLTLSQYDKSDLLRRGFTEDQISDLGFKSADKFQKLSKEVDWRTPGVVPSGRTLYVMGENGGYLCPVRDVDGNIVAMQVRFREAEPGDRYRWLSSGVKKRPKAPSIQVREEMPLSIFNPASEGSALWLVEGTGPKPAWVACKYNCPVIGASGAQWAYSPKTLEGAIAKIKPSRIILAADAGCIEVDNGGNQHTLHRYRATFDLLAQLGYALEIAWWEQDSKSDSDIDELEDLSIIKAITMQELIAKGDQKKQEHEKWKLGLTDDTSLSREVVAGLPEMPEPVPLGEKPPDSAPWEVRLKFELKVYLNEEDELRQLRIKNEIGTKYELKEKDFYKAIAYVDSPSHEKLEHAEGAYDEAFSRMADESAMGVPTGHRELDEKIGGLQASSLIIVPADPNTGKTAFALHLARQYMKRSPLPVAFFSLESPRVNVATRLLAQESEVPAWKIKSGRMWDTEMERVLEASDRLKKMPFYIDPTPAISPARIKRKLMAMHEKLGQIGLVLVDHAHIMSGEGQGDLECIKHIANSLQGMSREFKTCIMLLSQTNQGRSARSSKEPEASDIRYGAPLHAAADLITFLHRPELFDADTPDRGIMQIHIIKQREGAAGRGVRVDLLFEPECLLFKDT
jgi:replicative DNA helicase